ncbi:MAG TPA: DUF6796 family protein [Acidisarcina sp.]
MTSDVAGIRNYVSIRQDSRVSRLAGICGLVGAMLFFAGDMLFYGFVGSGRDFAAQVTARVMSESTMRLTAGGIIGPLAAGLCIIGFWHVYTNIHPSWANVGKVMMVAFFCLMVAGSAVHTLWTAKGFAIKFCTGQPGPCSEVLKATRSYWTLAYWMCAVPGYIGAGILLLLVAFGKSNCPRWTIVANPAFLALFGPFLTRVPAPLGAFLVGGFENLSIAVFFLVSIVTTWSRSGSFLPRRVINRSAT